MKETNETNCHKRPEPGTDMADNLNSQQKFVEKHVLITWQFTYNEICYIENISYIEEIIHPPSISFSVYLVWLYWSYNEKMSYSLRNYYNWTRLKYLAIPKKN